MIKNFKIILLTALFLVLGCKNVKKSVIGFWQSSLVLLDGSQEAEAIEIIPEGTYCAPDTHILRYRFPKLYLNFRKNNRYMITGRYVSIYERRTKNCGSYTFTDTFSFNEEGSWTQTEKGIILLIPRRYSPINGYSGAYECHVIEANKEVLQLKCNINREIDILSHGEPARVVHLIEIESVPVTAKQ